MYISPQLLYKILSYLDLKKLQIIRKLCCFKNYQWKNLIDELIFLKLYIKYQVSNIHDLVKKIKCDSCKTVNLLCINLKSGSTYCRKCFIFNDIAKKYVCSICQYFSLTHDFDNINDNIICKNCTNRSFFKIHYWS